MILRMVTPRFVPSPRSFGRLAASRLRPSLTAATRSPPWRTTLLGTAAAAAAYSHSPSSWLSTASCAAADDDGERLLPATDDPYGGIIINSAELPEDVEVFRQQLVRSLASWRSTGKRGIWLKVPIAQAAKIPVATELGFEFHHAEKGYVQLTQWLPKDVPSPLPPNASTQVGVGCIVVNREGQVILVQEGAGPLKGKDTWKIITGLVEQGEDIAAGAMRECLEEVGIRAHFERILGFRHMHGAAFGKGDLFFVCLLRCDEADEGKPFKLQASEIAKAKWDSFDSFLTQKPYPARTPVWAKLYSLAVGPSGRVGEGTPGLHVDDLSNGHRPGTSKVYSVPSSPASKL